MESRKRSRRGNAPSRVALPAAAVALLLPPHIEALVEHGGQITLGAMNPIKCAAIATDDASCLAMLQRRPGESLSQLLERLDAAIELAWTEDKLTDEINPPLPATKRR